MPRDFDYRILDERDHRPWPMPSQPWMMTQTWHDLLFAHWPVVPSQLAPRIPAGFDLDLFDGAAWIGIVPFRMSNVVPRGLPALPGASAFPELNVRTYVRVGGRSGVFFFSLDASSPLAVIAARALFQLPYHWATMRVDVRDGVVEYRSRRSVRDERGRFASRYRPEGDVFTARPGTLDHFLTERYCLYTTFCRSVLSVDIHHPSWRLQRGRATFEENTMAEAAGIEVSGPPALLHFAKRQDVVVWPPRTADRHASNQRGTRL